LGYYDAAGDGLAFSHQVGIFNDSTQQNLVSGTVDSGTTDPLVDGYRVIPVSYTLLPGTYDVLGFNPASASPDAFYAVSPTATPVAGLTFDTAVGKETSSFAFNNVPQSGANIGFFGPNFFVTTTVPEPGSFLLTGFATFGLVFWKRCRARANHSSTINVLG
jgi:hypothetical protein